MIGFTCCVNYSDMLALTWPFNRKYFDAYVVVTSPTDERTISYCVHNGIKVLTSEAYMQDGSAFNRAAMLNRAIEYCIKAYPDQWLVSMDADVIMDVVDDNLRWIDNLLIADWCGVETQKIVLFGNEIEMDKGMIYGCPRKMIRTQTELTIANLRRPSVGEWFDYPFNLTAYLGYFQMFYKRTARNDESYKTVNNSDTAFLDRNFGINNARTFRNLVCYHLGEPGVNWEGRKSEEWKKNHETYRP